MDQFAWELQHHPNQQQMLYVLEGLHNGFRLGFLPRHKLKYVKRKKTICPSSCYCNLRVSVIPANEVSLARVAGPLCTPLFPNLHVSSFGLTQTRISVYLLCSQAFQYNLFLPKIQTTKSTLIAHSCYRIVSLGWYLVYRKKKTKIVFSDLTGILTHDHQIATFFN